MELQDDLIDEGFLFRLRPGHGNTVTEVPGCVHLEDGTAFLGTAVSSPVRALVSQ